MDPKANLERQRELAALLLAAKPVDDIDPLDVLELAELVVALDEWREKGGFNPYDDTQKVHVVVWTDTEGDFNAQAYRTEEAARRDFGSFAYEDVALVSSTVQS